MTEKTHQTRDDARIAALLDAARPTMDAERESALLDRIVAAAERSPRLTIVARDEAIAPVRAVTATPQPARRARRDLFGAASLLAASLVLGIFLGQSPYSEQTITRIELATGITLANASPNIAQVLAAAELDEDD